MLHERLTEFFDEAARPNGGTAYFALIKYHVL